MGQGQAGGPNQPASGLAGYRKAAAANAGGIPRISRGTFASPACVSGCSAESSSRLRDFEPFSDPRPFAAELGLIGRRAAAGWNFAIDAAKLGFFSPTVKDRQNPCQTADGGSRQKGKASVVGLTRFLDSTAAWY